MEKIERISTVECNIAEVKPEFRKFDGTNVRIIDMGDDEILHAIDFMESLIERKDKELNKLSKVKKYLVLEYELRQGSHIVTPCIKGDNIYVRSYADVSE